MEAVVRVRLKFDSSPANYARKCWFMFDREKCRLVGDVSHLIASHFNLKRSQGIQLYMDDFLIPTNESALLIRDNDTIQVKMVSKPSESEATSSSSSSDEESVKKVQAERAQAKKPGGKASDAKATGNKTPLRSAPAKELVGVTTQSASGGLHTKFQSSSEDTSSESSSDSDTCAKTTPKEKVGVVKKAPPISQWDMKPKGVAMSAKNAMARVQIAGNVFDGTIRAPLLGSVGRGRGRGTTPIGEARGRGAGVGRGARGRGRNRSRRRKAPGKDVIVGGPNDILTTKSVLYTSPSTVEKKTSGEKDLVTSDSTNSSQSLRKAAPGAGKKEDVVAASGGEASAADDQTTADQAGENAGNEESEQAAEIANDYSSFPELQGPPRVGDTLAFKILQLSSSYTPEISDFLEASVLGVEEDTVKVRYTDATVSMLIQKAKEDNPGKFELPDAESVCSAEDPLLEVPQEVELPINDLLVPKLIT